MTLPSRGLTRRVAQARGADLLLPGRQYAPTLGLSLKPVHDYLIAIALMARGQERQAIMDALPKEVGGDRSDDWKAGHAAALCEVVSRRVNGTSVATKSAVAPVI
jgi:hypothetical protein